MKTTEPVLPDISHFLSRSDVHKPDTFSKNKETALTKRPELAFLIKLGKLD